MNATPLLIALSTKNKLVVVDPRSGKVLRKTRCREDSIFCMLVRIRVTSDVFTSSLMRPSGRRTLITYSWSEEVESSSASISKL